MRTRAERRKNDYNKAIKKKNIAEHNYGSSWYDNLHQYSKNKIHCSCPLCSAKTSKYGNTPNYKHSDELKIYSMNSKLAEM
jgi:hypothetical protein